MKKVLSAVVAVFTLGFANAQEIKFGAKTGMNLSSIKSSSNGDTKSLVGFHIGGLAEIKLNDKMSIQPELLFSQEGGKYEFTDNILGTILTYNQEIKLSKINIPVSFKYYVIERLSIEAGPQFDFIMKAKSVANASLPAFSSTLENNTDLSNSSSLATYIDTTDGSVQDTDIFTQNYGLKKLNIGFNIGAGYELPVGVFFQARYTIGLTDFTNNANFLAGRDSAGDRVIGSGNPAIDAKYDNTSLKSSNLQLSVGYKF